MQDQPYPTYRDQLLTCKECGIQWVWTVTEQRRLAEAGKPLDPPEYCPACQRLTPSPGHQRGIVKWYSTQKGYGFITLPSGDEIFFHRTGLDPESPPPNEGDLVEFRIEKTHRGPQATSVTVLERAKDLPPKLLHLKHAQHEPGDTP
ncbi:MAG: cold shock domain-containing protein [Chloroflexi bacterium]|nr:cold shock domain-containing protein [Chloroflexota bacterium]